MDGLTSYCNKCTACALLCCVGADPITVATMASKVRGRLYLDRLGAFGVNECFLRRHRMRLRPTFSVGLGRHYRAGRKLL